MLQFFSLPDYCFDDIDIPSWAFFQEIGQSTIPTSLPTTDWCAPEGVASPSEGSGSPASPWDSLAKIGLGMQDIRANNGLPIDEAARAASYGDGLVPCQTEKAENGH